MSIWNTRTEHILLILMCSVVTAHVILATISYYILCKLECILLQSYSKDKFCCDHNKENITVL